MNCESKNDLLRLHANSTGDGDNSWMTYNIRIRRQQRKALVHDSVRAADLTDLIIPTAVRNTPVLHSHRLDRRALNQQCELVRVNVADADHASAARTINSFDSPPHVPILLDQSGIGIRTMQKIGIDVVCPQ